MIVSFRDSETKGVFEGERSKRLSPSLHRVAMRKLRVLHATNSLNDLRVPPGNRLEKLSGTWSAYHSIRINDQWRIRFRWSSGNVHDVEILDYH